MIQSYRDERTRDFVDGKRIREFQEFERQAYRRLAFLGDAVSVDDLRRLPSNAFEALHGDRASQFSIRINRQWRICFHWPEGASGPADVEIVDYRQRGAAMGPAIHPGEILAEELEFLGMSAAQLGRTLGVPTNRITRILRGERRVTADTALRLSRWLGTSPQLWTNLQASYDIRVAEVAVGEEIVRTVVPRAGIQEAAA